MPCERFSSFENFSPAKYNSIYNVPSGGAKCAIELYPTDYLVVKILLNIKSYGENNRVKRAINFLSLLAMGWMFS